MAKKYDLIIIGTGSGNSIPGPDLAPAIQSIAIIEEKTFGGTCLNVGCIPTKIFVYTAEVAQTIRESARYGIHSTVESIDWPAIRDRVFSRIDPIVQGGTEYRKNDPNIDVYEGHGEFIDSHTLKVNGEEISADRIIIAAGARPTILPEIADLPYYTNEDIMRIDALPQRMIILGGGYIASEFAHVFSSFGVEVHQVNRSEKLLRHLDESLSQGFTDIAGADNPYWNLHLGRTIAHAEAAPELGKRAVRLTLDNGEVVEAEALLSATGRTPNGDRLNAQAAGLELDGSRIKVDEYGRTNIEGIWALGDVSSPYQLKHVANAEMRAVRHNLLHPQDLQAMPHDAVPAAVFTHPQLAFVGLTQKEAEEKYGAENLSIKTQYYGDIAYGWAMEDTTSFAKLIAHKETGKLLGAHIMGPQASTLIHELISLIRYDIDLRTFARGQYWVHPALSELIENAILGLEFHA